MNAQQPVVTLEPTQNGDGHPQAKTFSQEQLETIFQNYRTGIMELKAQREGLIVQQEELQKKVHELDIQIARTEGAALGLSNILYPERKQ